MLNVVFKHFPSEIQPKKIVAKSFDFKDMRKLPVFGYTERKDKVDFSWPSRQEDILESKDGNPVRVIALHWQLNKWIAGVQIELSNG